MFGVDDQRSAHPIGRGRNDRTHHGEHHRSGLAGAGLAKGKDMTAEELARDIAVEGKQRMPLGDPEPSLARVRNRIGLGERARATGDRVRARCRRTGSEIGDGGRSGHSVDEAQRAGKSARDRKLQGKQLAIDGAERHTIPGTGSGVHSEWGC